MKKIDRYILGGFLLAWAAAVIFFIGMYLLIHFFNKAGDLTETAQDFERAGFKPFAGFCRYYALNIPFVVVEILPYTVLMGGMWAAQQMSRRNELVPVLAAGVSFRRLALPLLVAGFVIGLAFAGVNEVILPLLAPERHRMEMVVKGKSGVNLKDLDLLTDERGHVLNIREYDVRRDTAYGVTFRTAGNPAAEGLFAEAMRYDPEGPRGPGWYPLPETILEGAAEGPLPTDLVPHDIEIAARQLLYLPVEDLKRLLERHPGRANLEIVLYGHYAYPLRTLVLLLIGLPLVLRSSRKTAYVAVGLSLLVSVGFFSVLSVVQELGRRGELLNPLLGAWLPIILFGALGLLVFETMST